MRIVFIGASDLSIGTVKALVEKGHEIIIVETDKTKIDELSEEMDCSFLLGDGSRPDILREVNPEQTDILFCLTDSDQANVIASLVGRSLKFKRVVTSIRDEQLEDICQELRLKDTIIPSRTISRYLVDLVGGSKNAELSKIIKDEARFFMFTATYKEAEGIKGLKLPQYTRVICYYRDGKFAHANGETALQAGDEIVILTHSNHLNELEKRWQPKQRVEKPSDSALSTLEMTGRKRWEIVRS